ncbi:MAG: adenine deaminase [Bacteroidota bacterium]|nr:adenine deaminase [Bacteroidota bacterium]
MKEIKGKILDVFKRKIFSGIIQIKDGKIININECEVDDDCLILPGLIDSHVHIESSMLLPSSFSKLIVPRGTVAVVCDPHEIANVCGEEGIEYMIEDGKRVPLKFFFGVPSCVPATLLEHSGAILNSQTVERLIERDDFYFLAEMMNYPGVINNDEEVIKKIRASQKVNKPIDGHAPDLSGQSLNEYANKGILTDHECSSLEEAVEKINLGMHILIREGSAAKNFEKLYPLISEYPDKVMFCTDDSHPDDLLQKGHIDSLIKRGLKLGLNIFDLIRVSSVNAVLFYKLPVGLLRVGDKADFIVVDNLDDFNIQRSYIDGECVYDSGRLLYTTDENNELNNFQLQSVNIEDIKIKNQNKTVRVIEIEEGQLLTKKSYFKIKSNEEFISADLENDILKVVVVDRYQEKSIPQVGFIKGFGLKKGAFGSSIAHDSHNLIVVGVDDESIYKVLLRLIQNKGGLVVCDEKQIFDLKLKIGGLMSSEEGEVVSQKYAFLNEKIHQQGCILNSPFMTLSFMSLLVIPHLKIGDRGLFDVDKFEFISLFEE